jgi:hypothetical protein
MIDDLKPGDRLKSDYSDAVLVFKEFTGKYAILEVEKTGIRIKANKLHLNGTNKFKRLNNEM